MLPNSNSNIGNAGPAMPTCSRSHSGLAKINGLDSEWEKKQPQKAKNHVVTPKKGDLADV
eukprot:6800961-Ditylum_brightwellii.AAC.1